MSDSAAGQVETELSASERELLREVLHALQTIRYGSVVLTVHDGQLVEIHKTEKIRKRGEPGKDKQTAHQTTGGLLPPTPRSVQWLEHGL